MFDIKTLALLKHGKVWGAKNIVESALLNKWSGGASYEKTVGPAHIISISDAKAKPAKSLVVGMEPVQDLHGYDSPWPAGGGKNLFNKDEQNIVEDAYVSTTGSYMEASLGEKSIQIGFVKAGTYTISKISSSRFRVGLWDERPYYGPDSQSARQLWTANPQTSESLTITTETDGFLAVFVYNGSSETVNVQQIIDSFQLERGSTASPWSPYSNICPISGRTGVTVERTGKNLCDHSELVQGITAYVTGEIANVANRVTSGFIPVYEGESYIASIGSGKKVVNYHLYDSAKTGIGGNVNQDTVTIPTGVAYIRFVFGNSDDSDITPSDITDAQIELGSTASAYEPYTGASYPVVFPDAVGTVYGGTVDVVSGVLTVDRILQNLDDSTQLYADGNNVSYRYDFFDRKIYTDSFSGLICSAFPADDSKSQYCRWRGASQYRLSFVGTSIAALTTLIDNESLQISYPIATPITYQLDPQTVRMLKGANVLWSDADDLTLTYLGTTPANLLGGMLGGGLGGAQEPIEETSEESVEEPVSEEQESPPDEQETEETEEP